MAKDREQKIKKLMDLRGYSYDEALQIVLDDEAVDRGEPLPWDLTPEQKKIQKKARQGDSKPRPTEKKLKEKKVDHDKKALIDLLVESLNTVAGNVEITNAERELNFEYNERKFKIILSAPRK